MSFRVTVTQRVVQTELLKGLGSQSTNPTGSYDYVNANTSKEALDEFRNHVAVTNLDDFLITTTRLQRLCITQIYRVERIINVFREAETVTEAIEAQDDDQAPPYDDSAWVEYPELMNETVTPSYRGD